MDRKQLSIRLVILLVTAAGLSMNLGIDITDVVTGESPPPDDNINGTQYIEGNWNVSATKSYSGEIIILTGNLTISDGGNLTFNNVTLMMNCTNFDGEYNIEVQSGGTLSILNGSIITDSPSDADDNSASDFEFMFWVREGSNFTMRDSELHECGWDWDNKGFTIETNGAVIENNVFSHNYVGTNLNVSSNSSLIFNTIFNNSMGITLLQTSNNNIISNTIFNTSSYAVYIETSSNNIFEQNFLTSNGAGIFLTSSSSNNKIINNTIEYSINYGISCFGSSDGNILTDNIIRYHSFYGIKVKESSNTYMSSNKVYNNSWYGFYITGASKSVIRKNIIYNNPYGIVFDGGPNSSISGNTIYNSSYGIDLASSNDTISNNTIHDSLNIGIAVFFSSKDNFFFNNTVFKNGDGIVIGVNSNNNIFSRNRIFNNYKNGTYLFRNLNNTFINCSITNSTYYDVSLNSESHAILLNTSFNETNVYFDDESTLTVQWYMHVYVNSSTGNPVRDANVSIYNVTDDLIADGITDKNGFLRYIAVTERTQNSTTKITYSPYNVTAIKGGSVAYANPEPIVNGSKQVNVTFVVTPSPLHHIVIYPKGPETYEIGEKKTYKAEGWNDADEIQLNTTWTPVWSADNTTVGIIESDTGNFTAVELGSSVVNVTSSEFTGIYNTSEFTVIPSPLHHVVITPIGPEEYYIGDMITYTAIGWDDAEETRQNTTWTPVWSVDNPSIASINSNTGEFNALALGSSVIRVRDSVLTSIFNTSAFTIIPWPLHHIEIITMGPETHYIDDSRTYIAVGWNDAIETQENTTWTPVWSVDNTSVATINSNTGLFTAIALGSSVVNVTSAVPTDIYVTSPFTVEPWPLHHIVISPVGPENCYIDDAQTYTAIGWNDAVETQQNMTWIAVWSVDNASIASIDSATGDFIALALGSSAVNVTDSTFSGVYNSSIFTIEPWPLHHIVITPIGPERYYVGDVRTYTAIGWNDAAETQQNTSWVPVWSVDESSIAIIDPDTGDFTAIALGNTAVNVTSAAPTGIYNMSNFIVEPWPLHHIVITLTGPKDYYIGDTQTYTAIGWNDAAEIQMNDTWVPTWSIENMSVASINGIGYFTALALGSSVINVTCSSQPGVYATSAFTVSPWPLHHISIMTSSLKRCNIDDEIVYTAIGWNDITETQENHSWSPVWSVEGGVGVITGEGYQVTFKAKKSGDGSIRCSDEVTDIYASSQITVKEKGLDETLIWVWILLVVIIIVACLLIILLLFRKKARKDTEKVG